MRAPVRNWKGFGYGASPSAFSSAGSVSPAAPGQFYRHNTLSSALMCFFEMLLSVLWKKSGLYVTCSLCRLPPRGYLSWRYTLSAPHADSAGELETATSFSASASSTQRMWSPLSRPAPSAPDRPEWWGPNRVPSPTALPSECPSTSSGR